MIDCFERFSLDPTLLGHENMEKIVEHIGIDAKSGLLSLFKDGGL